MIEQLAIIAVLMLTVAWIPQIIKGFREEEQKVSYATSIIYLVAGSVLVIYNIGDDINFLLNFSIISCVSVVFMQALYYNKPWKKGRQMRKK